jgi:hypothetical protein
MVRLREKELRLREKFSTASQLKKRSSLFIPFSFNLFLRLKIVQFNSTSQLKQKMLDRFLGPRRVRQIQRAARNGTVTLLCLFLTVVVLRGTIGAGKFGTQSKTSARSATTFTRAGGAWSHTACLKKLSLIPKRTNPTTTLPLIFRKYSWMMSPKKNPT